MPRYFFHTTRVGQPGRDTVGTVLYGLNEARVEAVRRAGAVIEESAAGILDHGDWQMEVRDANDVILFWLDFIVTPSMV